MSENDSAAVCSSFTAHIETPLYPTESVERVVEALENVFPEGSFEVSADGGSIVGDSELENLRYLLRKQKIRDAARAYISSRPCSSSSLLVLLLSKQAAFAGCANFVESPSSMGDISMCVEGDVEDFTNWIAGKSDESMEVEE